MVVFSFIRLDSDNDAGELEVTATAGGFSGRMSRFMPRGALLSFAEQIRATDHFWRPAEVVFTTVYPDYPLDQQPPSRCTIRLASQGTTGHILMEVSLEEEVYIDAATRRSAATQLAFLTTAHALMTFTDAVRDAASHERLHAVIA